jgi:predicted DNA-binding antitoxin AbrB/MazE fold protein
MVLTIEATYENGVFVPSQRPVLPDHERVRLTIESMNPTPAGVEAIRNRQDHRIRVDPILAQEIAQSPEFDSDGI